MNLPGFITVRTSSSRLPAKCLLPFGGECNVLEHVIRRARHYGIIPFVCTSVDQSDNVIEEIAIAEGVDCYRGSLTNKLKRWADCAIFFGLEAFHTVDADDPFFDGDQVKQSMALLVDDGLDAVYPTVASSSGGASVGYSLTADIVKRASANLADGTDTEMMWYYLEKTPCLRSAVLPDSQLNPQRVRLTLDYQEDYWLLESVRRIVGNLAPRSEINQLFIRNPDMHRINWFRNEEWKTGQLIKNIQHG